MSGRVGHIESQTSPPSPLVTCRIVSPCGVSAGPAVPAAEGIDLLDHVIFNRTGYYSFLEEDRM